MNRPARTLRTLGQRWLVAVLWVGLCLSGAAHVGLHGHVHGHHGTGGPGHGAPDGHVHADGTVGSGTYDACAPVAPRRLAAEPTSAPTPEPETEPTSLPVEESGECALCALALVLPPNAPRAPTGVRAQEPSRALPAPVAPTTTPRTARVPRGPPRVG